MAYLDATTRLGLGGSSAIQYVGFTARDPSPDIVAPLRGGDSSKKALRMLMPDERLHRQILREDDEVLAIVIAFTESMNE